MFAPEDQKISNKERVRGTFTPSRLGLMFWAFAATIMATVGIASYQFDYRPTSDISAPPFPNGVQLPAVGDVTSTASIGTGSPIQVMPAPETGLEFQERALEQGQIEVLQREIAGLRRRLSALSEQNASYSRRIADLEKLVTASKMPGKGTIIESHVSKERKTSGSASPPAEGTFIAEVPLRTAASADKKFPGTATERRDDISRLEGAEGEKPAPDRHAQEPVRIIPLPDAVNESVVTGSITPQNDGSISVEFNDMPTRETPAPAIIAPSGASGRIDTGADSRIKRSDFGAVIGHFRSMAAAAKAWADFKEQNEERMRDLRPLLMERNAMDGGVSLLVGPFGNAADAALACFRLLEVTELCQPAIYAGDPLVIASEFRDTAF